MTAFDTAWELLKMPAADRRYTLTEDDIKKEISELKEALKLFEE